MRKSIRALCLVVLLGAGLFGAGAATAGDGGSNPCVTAGGGRIDASGTTGTWTNYHEVLVEEGDEGTVDPSDVDQDPGVDDNADPAVVGPIDAADTSGTVTAETEDRFEDQVKDPGDFFFRVAFEGPTCKSVRYELTVTNQEGKLLLRDVLNGNGVDNFLEWDTTISGHGQTTVNEPVDLWFVASQGQAIDQGGGEVNDTGGGGSSWFS